MKDRDGERFRGDEGDFAARFQALQIEDSLTRRALESLRPGREACEDCDEPIPAKRRKAYPQATRCVGCQTEYERSA